MIRLAVFDMAGTTINDRDEVYRVLREATEREGARYSDETFQQWMGTEKNHAIGQLLRVGGVEVTGQVHERAWQWFREELARTYTAHPPVALDGVTEALDELLARGIKIGLTTGFSREIVDLILGSMGWEIEFTVASDEVAEGRPSPLLIRRIMEQAGITDPAEVISAGDTAADVRSAQRAGVTSVGVLTGHLSTADFEELGADLILDSVADLPAHPVLECR